MASRIDLRRWLRAAYWIAPPAFCLWLYWLGIVSWFQQDDFAWLRLRQDILSGSDLLAAIFQPKAQGTIRPFSERLFFLVFSSLFGIDPLPFRIWVFLTQFANIALLMAIALRLTGSRLAAFSAAILWLANSGLAKVMTWTSAYNQILVGLFLLLSFYLLLRHIETGERRYWILQWLTFLLGFGAQELNVVYPALAAAYAFCCARPYFRKTLWLFPPSVLYAALHHWAAPPQAAGTYGLYFDTAILRTLATYWAWALTAVYMQPAWLMWTLTALLSAALIIFSVVQWRRGRRLAFFLLAWFLILIAPVLPLRAHITEYYLTLPTLGLAVLGGWALKTGLGGRWHWKAAAAGLVGIHLAASLPAARAVTAWSYWRSRKVRGLVRGVARAHELHPNKVILLLGVDTDLFWTGVFDQPFRLFGADSVYLTPGSEANIAPYPEFGEVADFVLPSAIALKTLEQGRAVVYSVEQDRLRNVTSLYKRVARHFWALDEPRRIDVGQRLFAPYLGGGWHGIQGRHRWMAKRATVRLGGPRRAGEKLYITGTCPAIQLARGPVTMTLSVDEFVLPPVQLSQPGSKFQFSFDLPAQLLGRKSVEIAVEVDRTFTVPNDGRPLGAAFGTFAIR